MVVVADRSVASPHTARSVTENLTGVMGIVQLPRMILWSPPRLPAEMEMSMASIFTGTPEIIIGNSHWNTRTSVNVTKLDCNLKLLQM